MLLGCVCFGAITLNFFDADHVQWEGLVECVDGVDDHLAEEFCVVGDQLGAHGGAGAPHQHSCPLLLAAAVKVEGVGRNFV